MARWEHSRAGSEGDIYTQGECECVRERESDETRPADKSPGKNQRRRGRNCVDNVEDKERGRCWRRCWSSRDTGSTTCGSPTLPAPPRNDDDGEGPELERQSCSLSARGQGSTRTRSDRPPCLIGLVPPGPRPAVVATVVWSLSWMALVGEEMPSCQALSRSRPKQAKLYIPGQWLSDTCGTWQHPQHDRVR